MAPGNFVVPPRVFLPGQSSPVRLDRAIALFLDVADDKPIHIHGTLGFGITTAIEYVRRTFANRRDLFLIDESARIRDWFGDPNGRRVIIGSISKPYEATAVTLQLAPWTRDDLIEYLLLVAPKLCAGVMRRIESNLANDVFAGYPALWTIAIDQMLMDEAIPDPIAALDRCVDRYIRGKDRDELLLQCFLWLSQTYLRYSVIDEKKFLGHSNPLRKLVRCRPFQLLYGQHAGLRRLIEPGWIDVDQERWPAELISRVAALVGQNPALVEQILRGFPKLPARAQPTAASVLTASKLPWEIPANFVPKLDCADLGGVAWSSRDLHGLSAPVANFSGAVLSEMRMDEADLRYAIFVNAKLDACSISGAVLESAEADQSRLTRCDFATASMMGASLAGAAIEQCNFVAADFSRVNLGSVVATRTDFGRVAFNAAKLADARFTDCSFFGAKFAYVDLRSTRLHGCRFDAATLRFCNLDGIEILEGNFRRAAFENCDLSGTHLPGASFHQATFASVGVMNASWPGADLTHADLRGLMFHAGSSRSGLVNSPLASEGTRTGFYTDESLEQSFREPEDIRRADLRGCDLRGANIEGVDFYLVDLRGAKLSEDQVPWLKQCRAIMTPT